MTRMNRNRKTDDDRDDDKDGDDEFAAISDKTSSTNLKTPSTSFNVATTSTKQRNKGSTDRTLNDLVAGDGDEKSTKMVASHNRSSLSIVTVRDRPEKPVYLHSPPIFSKKAYAIGFILIACVVIAIIINFINLHSDFQDLKDFHRGYMGRKLLIIEGRLTSRTYLHQLKEFTAKIEVLSTDN